MRELREVQQVIDLIKNLKKVSTNSKVANLLGIDPRTLLAAVKKKKITQALTIGLIEFAKTEHITIDYLLIDFESWIKESQVLRIFCSPVKLDKEGRAQEYLSGGDTWELRYIIKGKEED